MRKSLIASFVVHAGLLAYALYWIPAVAPLKVSPQDAVPVMVTIGDAALKKAQTKEPAEKKPEKPKPKKTETVEEVKPQEKVAPEEVKAAHEKNVEKDTPKPKEKPEMAQPEEPKPLDSKELAELIQEPEPKKEEPKPKEEVKPKEEPKPDQAALDAVLKQTLDEQAEAEKKAAEAEAEKKAEAEAKKKAEEAEKKKAEAEAKKKTEAEAKKKAQAEAKKKADAEAKKKKVAEEEAKKQKTQFNTAALNELLNKIPDDAAAPEKSADNAGEPEIAERNESGNDDAEAATLAQALSAHIFKCWTVPPGAVDAGIVIKVRFKLNEDGSVAGTPQVVNSADDPLFKTTANSIVAAIKKCQSYDFLPREKYELWQSNTMDFDPSST